MGDRSVQDPGGAIDALYRRAMAREQGGREVLRGRLLLRSLLEDPHPGDGVVRIRDLDEITRLVTRLGEETVDEIVGFVPALPYAAEQLAAAVELDLDLIRRGVTARYVCDADWIRERAGSVYAAAITQAGGDMGVIDRVPHWMMIYDRAVAVVPNDPVTTGEPGALLVRDRPTVHDLYALFTRVWQRSTSVLAYTPDDADGCDARERQVLELMSSGATDAAAARALAISARTYRRHVSALMQRLGAHSRFQAGVRAAERGWI